MCINNQSAAKVIYALMTPHKTMHKYTFYHRHWIKLASSLSLFGCFPDSYSYSSTTIQCGYTLAIHATFCMVNKLGEMVF